MRPRFRTDAERTFAFRLARDLGMTYGQLRRQMSASEFQEWLAFYSYERKMEQEAERKARRKA